SYVHRLDVERAEPLIDRALELAEESGSLLNEGAALDVRGSLERVRGNFEAAEEAFAAAAARYQEIGFPLREASIELQLGRAAQGRDDEAELLLGEALKRLEQSPFRSAEVEALRVYADFLREAGRDDEAAPLEARVAELSPVSTARMA